MTIYTGDTGNNTLNGSDGADKMYGLQGNDILNGKGGNDWIYGGDGQDTMDGGDGDDHLYGEVGNDILRGGYGDDTLDGGAGDDELYGGGGTNVLIGGIGNDHLSSGGDGAWITSTKMYGGPGNDVYFFSGVSSNIVFDDAVPQAIEYAYEGYDTIYLNTEFYNEMTSYTMPANIEALHLLRVPGPSLHGPLDEYAIVQGNSMDNVIVGTPEDDSISGGDGNDTLYSRELSDVATARRDDGRGEDGMSGGNGNDKLYAVGPDRPAMDGGWGDDEFHIGNNGYYGTDIGQFAGWKISEAAGQGDDTLYTASASTFLPKNVETLVYDGTATATRLWGNAQDNTIIGGAQSSDEISGYEGDDLLDGGLGNGSDTLLGGSGNDALYGRGGDDKLYGESGNDHVYGGDGNDTMFGGSGDDWMTGEAGNDSMSGDDGVDTMFGGDGNDMMWGGKGADSLSGGAGVDWMYGGDDNDYLFGGDGDDALLGDNGNDIVSGWNGNDTLYGGMGTDTLTGGAGADKFMFTSTIDSGSAAGKDTITDFQHGVDKIDLSMMDAHAYMAGNQAFTFRGTAGFSAGWHPAELIVAYEGGNTIVRGDTDGVGGVDVEIILTGTITLDINDFVL